MPIIAEVTDADASDDATKLFRAKIAPPRERQISWKPLAKGAAFSLESTKPKHVFEVEQASHPAEPAADADVVMTGDAETAAADGGADEDQSVDRAKPENDGVHAPPEQQAPHPKRQMITRRAMPKGMELVPIAKDGNCLFGSIARCIRQCNKKGAKAPAMGARKCRCHIVEHMR